MSDAKQAKVIDGSLKAAILMLSLGEQSAANVLRKLEPQEVQKIGKAMIELEQIPREQVQKVLDDFLEKNNSTSGIASDTGNYIQKILVNALGKEKASSVLNNIVGEEEIPAMESLKWMDAQTVVELIRDEHPQVIALILSNLESSHSAAILQLLVDDEQRLEVVQRIADLQEIHPSALDELNKTLEVQIHKVKNMRAPSIDGIKRVANIINYLSANTEQQVMKLLTKKNKQLKGAIEDLMFIFEDFGEADDRTMQALLKDINTDDLMIALKGADDRIKNKFFNNMSSRAADMLRDDMEAKGPVKLSEVEEAQKRVLAAAKKLADSGEISISKGGDDLMVE